MWVAWAKYTTARPIATHFPWHGCMYDLQLNVSLIRKLRCSLKCLAYLFDMSFKVVCTTRHWQTSGRLVQELNVCTVRCIIGMEMILDIDISSIRVDLSTSYLTGQGKMILEYCAPNSFVQG